MFEDFLNHSCEVYHLTETPGGVTYGIPGAETESIFSYPQSPDIESVACHFQVKASPIQIIAGEPDTEAQGRVKIAFPFGTDIRINDKIKSHETGLSYIAELPRAVHGDHHLVVYARRESGIKAAI